MVVVDGGSDGGGQVVALDFPMGQAFEIERDFIDPSQSYLIHTYTHLYTYVCARENRFDFTPNRESRCLTCV